MKPPLLPVLERFPQKRAYSLVLLLSLIVGGLIIKTQFRNNQNTSLRLGYSFFGSIDEIDPLEINSIYQSNIIENIYSRLIEHDNAGQITCSICSSFHIDKNVISFYFDENNKSIDGYSIGAEDAKISLERIAASQSNTHGSLKYYLESESLDSLKFYPGKLSIKVARVEWVPFVLSLLTSMDFSVIPKDSLDLSSNKIIDYRNTSGLFYVASSSEDGRLHLKANLGHGKYQKNMLDDIYFVPIKSGEASQAFLSGTIDMIDPTYYAYDFDVQNILRSVPGATVHETLHIGLTSLVFSRKVMNNSSTEDRLAAALSIKEWFLNETDKIYGATETEQYFQSFGQGFITGKQKEALIRRATKMNGSRHKFIFGLTEKYRAWINNYSFPDFIEVRFYKSYPGFLPDEEKPDMYLLTADSSFDEDISALSYLFSQGIFSFGKSDGANWIQEYMNLPSREERIQRLGELHFTMLESVKVFPIISRPYIAILRPEFEMNFPKIYAGSPMWKVWKR